MFITVAIAIVVKCRFFTSLLLTLNYRSWNIIILGLWVRNVY